jgi:phage gp37-like protein
MTGYSWTALEDAVVTALQGEMGAQIKTLETYQGDWRADLQQETWRFPAVLVMLGRSRGEQVTLASYDVTLEFTVLVAVRHLRGEAAARHDQDGVYQLLEGVRNALWHQDLGLELQPLALLWEEPLLNNQEFSVYAAHYATALMQTF